MGTDVGASAYVALGNKETIMIDRRLELPSFRWGSAMPFIGIIAGMLAIDVLVALALARLF